MLKIEPNFPKYKKFEAINLLLVSAQKKFTYYLGAAAKDFLFISLKKKFCMLIDHLHMVYLLFPALQFYCNISRSNLYTGSQILSL